MQTQQQNTPPGPPSGAPAGPPPGVPAGPPPGPDPVSGALNLAGFGQAYGKVMAQGSHDQIALWFLDIRNFRSVNPKFGFLKGNDVLRTCAQCIREVLCHDLPVARLGGDRFVFLTAGKDFDCVSEEFERLVVLLNERTEQQGVRHTLDLSAGVYFLQQQDLAVRSFQTPLDYASIAHRNAHSHPKSYLAQFTQEDLERDTRRITIEQTIDEALVTGQVQVWYQPQVDYTYGEVIGAEALARWKHPELGWISPMEFIPVLEACGKVHDLDLFIWEEACRNAGRWRNVADGKPVPISVNISRAEMFEPGLLEHFLELQKKYNLPDGSLRLEVTESAFVEEAERLYSVIETMREHNMMVEMDDFGSGLSSLTMLKDVPVDVVKLDMGFMRSAVNEDRGGVVLGSVIRMLQGLDTPIIAEGVETLEQAEMLKNMGCHLMQGYHFSRPMPLDDFENFIASNRTVEQTERRKRSNAHLDELLSFDHTSSFLFNHAMGGTMFFFVSGGQSESILVNDEFYAACGIERSAFGDAKVNPIKEIDPASRSTLWRAAAEAREHGAALCRAKVLATGRWLECVMRYLGESSRGDVYSLNIVRSGRLSDDADNTDNAVTSLAAGGGADGVAAAAGDNAAVQVAQDVSWDMDLLNNIVPNGFVKCALSDELDILYISPELYRQSGLSESEFTRRFHNSMIETILEEDLGEFREALEAGRRTRETFSCDVRLHHGYGSEYREVHIIGRIKDAADGPSLYLLVLDPGEVVTSEGLAAAGGELPNVIPFEYDMKAGVLTVHQPLPDGTARDIVIADWLKALEATPDMVSPSSAAKILAIERDLRHHPIVGFTDIKCNYIGSDTMRWYHIDYTCDADENGDTAVVRGYAHDANDKMGSARWWRQQAEIDQLTGLLNRNAVEQNINLAMRTHGAGLMFMIDLDGFKRINDELGHLAGDAMIRDVAEALGGCFREGDLLGRYGGDEFIAFLPLLDFDAEHVASRVASDVINAVMEVQASDGTHAGCSVGVAVCHDREATFYDLLEVADNAMYQSKEGGKGTYTIAEM